MKLIQIFALVAALAVTAAAQSTSTNNQNAGSASPAKPAVKTSSGKSAQKGGTGNQTSPVTLTVPKNSQATAGSKSSTSASSTPAKSTAKNGTSQTAVPKTPVLVAKPAQQPATSSKSSATAKTAKTAKTADKTVAAKPKVPKKTVVATKKEQARLVPQKVADNKKKPGSGEETIKSGPAGRRDPFLSVIRTAPSGPTGPSCSVGKKCLYIPELVVKGIAKDTEGQMMAVVVSNTHRAYFLRENDQVFNGSVEKITSDSVVFREYATDHLGRETAHEVVKRIPKT